MITNAECFFKNPVPSQYPVLHYEQVNHQSATGPSPASSDEYLAKQYL